MTDNNLSVSPEQFLWTEKYRPKTIRECVVPEDKKKLFQSYVDSGEIPHFLFSGSPGTGKTTVAKALCNEIGADFLFVKASEDNGIDTIRTQIRQFCSTVSLTDAGKVVIMDEADNLSPAAQAALRSFIEEFASNARFIFTCNFKNRIIEAIHSRCIVVDFKIGAADRVAMAKQMLSRCEEILHAEGIREYDRKAVAALITKDFPDFRRVINILQGHAVSGTIDSSILLENDASVFDELIGALREKNFTRMRKWVGKNSDMDTAMFYHDFYQRIAQEVKPECLPEIILLLADYQYKSAFSIDQEICTAACMTEVMSVIKF